MRFGRIDLNNFETKKSKKSMQSIEFEMGNRKGFWKKIYLTVAPIFERAKIRRKEGASDVHDYKGLLLYTF